MSCLIPELMMPRPRASKDWRPVELTSHIIKTMERLVLKQLQHWVKPFLDPLQFAYQPGIGVEDAIIYLLNRGAQQCLPQHPVIGFLQIHNDTMQLFLTFSILSH